MMMMMMMMMMVMMMVMMFDHDETDVFQVGVLGRTDSGPFY